MDIAQNIERKVMQFSNFLKQPTSRSFQHKALKHLATTQLGQFDMSPVTNDSDRAQKLISKFKTMSLQCHKLFRKKWHANQKQILVALIAVVCGRYKKDPRELADSHWEEVAQFLLRTAEECRNRYLAALTLQQNKPWSDAEDQVLAKLVAGDSLDIQWTQVSEVFNRISPRNREVYRNSRRCKQRWLNHLDPKVVKGGWTEQDDIQLLGLVIEEGKFWSRLSRRLSKLRTQNQIKNRYNALLRPQRYKGLVVNETDTVKTMLKLKQLLFESKKGAVPQIAQFKPIVVDHLDTLTDDLPTELIAFERQPIGTQALAPLLWPLPFQFSFCPLVFFSTFQ